MRDVRCVAKFLGWGERRRFWHDDDKLEIVMSVGVGGASVTQVAQRQEIRRQQIYAWRHDLKKKGLWSPDAGALFYPVEIPITAGAPVPHLPATETPPPTAVELRLRGGRCLHFDSIVGPVALTSLRWQLKRSSSFLSFF